jgi:hypothetical protein
MTVNCSEDSSSTELEYRFMMKVFATMVLKYLSSEQEKWAKKKLLRPFSKTAGKILHSRNAALQMYLMVQKIICYGTILILTDLI